MNKTYIDGDTEIPESMDLFWKRWIHRYLEIRLIFEFLNTEVLYKHTICYIRDFLGYDRRNFRNTNKKSLSHSISSYWIFHNTVLEMQELLKT